MKSGKIWFAVVSAWLLLAMGNHLKGQESESISSENRLLRSTNDRLARENESLRAEVESIKKRLAQLEATTRPVALSTSGDAAQAAAKRVVFIMDGSGSMFDAFEKERDDVRRWIEELKADQSFAVVFDREDGFNPFPKTLLPATEQNKARVLALFPKLFVRGTDNFSASLKTALAMSPDLIWWVGDAPQNGPSDLADIRKWNFRNARINTSPRNLDQDRDGRTMWFAWKLADDSDGTCLDANGEPVTNAPPEPQRLPVAPQNNGQLKVDVNRR